MTSDLPTTRFRRARRGDAGSILAWRNDAETRKLSGDTGEVSVERHQVWFGQMLVDPGCWFGVAEDGSGQPFGVVRFNLDPDDPSTAEVSINLAPEYRGRGLGGQCLQSAIHQYRGENRAVRQIRARVHEDNLPSQRMFESAGFVYDELPEGGFLVGWLRSPKVFSEGSGGVMNFSDRLTIGGKSLGLSEKPFLVAEVSANHNNDLQRAREIVLAAAANGADAVKFQTYTADTITLDSSGPDFLIHDGLWRGQRLYDLYSQGSLPWDWHGPLFELARSVGLSVISTPFDETAVDFLVDLGVDALKIASFELTHIPLIRKVADAGLPVIISTGMGTAAEIEEAVSAVDGISKDLILLHCVSSYPAEPKDYSLKNLVNLRERHGCLVGLSDHCVENRAAAASVLYDSVFIEKHFTLDRSGGGLDDSFSLEPSGLAELRAAVDEMFYAARHVSEVGESEKDNVSLRRSIYVSKPVRSGEVLTAENIRVVRPGFGMHPRHYDEVVGRRAVNDLEFASPLNRGDVDWSS